MSAAASTLCRRVRADPSPSHRACSGGSCASASRSSAIILVYMMPVLWLVTTAYKPAEGDVLVAAELPVHADAA